MKKNGEEYITMIKIIRFYFLAPIVLPLFILGSISIEAIYRLRTYKFKY